MRYTAATCDPDQFMEERYSLRQQLMSPPRQVELMIVMSGSKLFCVFRASLVLDGNADFYFNCLFLVAMYNEDDSLCECATFGRREVVSVT